MIEETAQVVSVDGEHAWLQTQRGGTCGSCSARGGCGVSLIERYAAKRQGRIRAINRVGAGAGAQVIVGIDESALLRGSAAVYLSPLAGLFGGAIIGEVLAPFSTLLSAEVASILLGLLGLAGGLLYLYRYAQRHRGDPRFQPVILRTVTAPPIAPLTAPSATMLAATKKGPGPST